jgi:hypothetical protein
LDSMQSLQDHAAASLQAHYYAHASAKPSNADQPSPPATYKMVISPQSTPPQEARNVKPRVPRMDLRQVNDAKNQSSDKDDDDPFTTRDYYQA